MNGNDILARLGETIDSRKPEAGGDPSASYVAKLFHKGLDSILKKVGEEATEVVLAAKDGDPAKLTYEVADLWFHSMIALSALGQAGGDKNPMHEFKQLPRQTSCQKYKESNHRSAPRPCGAQPKAAPLLS